MEAQNSLFWSVVKRAPSIYDLGYHAIMGLVRLGGMGFMFQNVPRATLEEFVDGEKPDVIISCHQSTAAALALARMEGRLTNARIGFVQTDYFTEFLPDVSRVLDGTFLPHERLEANWRNAGVSAERVTTAGMPVHPSALVSVDRDTFLRAHGLDPAVTTITLSSGGEGVGDFPTMVESLAERYDLPAVDGEPTPPCRLQIVAVCGKNQEHFRNLRAMEPALIQRGIRLVTLGFTKQDELFGYIRSSDLYITKSGGLSPSEGFSIGSTLPGGLPMVLLDVYGGHERINASFFEELGVAAISRDSRTLGSLVHQLLSDPARRTTMAEAQREFAGQQHFERIADFVLK
jgi:UDP-N-acetylglucosamine:LPS N-acetylglucosamine transferase